MKTKLLVFAILILSLRATELEVEVTEHLVTPKRTFDNKFPGKPLKLFSNSFKVADTIDGNEIFFEVYKENGKRKWGTFDNPLVIHEDRNPQPEVKKADEKLITLKKTKKASYIMSFENGYDYIRFIYKGNITRKFSLAKIIQNSKELKKNEDNENTLQVHGNPELIQIQYAGNDKDHISVVILSAGFLATEKDKFISQVKQCYNILMNTQPFKRYIKSFNLYAVWQSSAVQGGKTNGNNLKCLITPTSFNCDNTLATNIVRSTSPGSDYIVILLNDNTYGGVFNGLSLTYNGEHMAKVFIHELGHAFRLADEYSYGKVSGGFGSFGLNCASNINNVYWNHFINKRVPGVGKFATCGYTDFFKPTESCLMNSIFVSSEFCPVCKELLVKRFYVYGQTAIHSTCPPTHEPVFVKSNTIFKINLFTHLQFVNTNDKLEIVWELIPPGESSRVVLSNAMEYSFISSKLGRHIVQAKVTDRANGWILQDLPAEMTKVYVFILDVQGSCSNCFTATCLNGRSFQLPPGVLPTPVPSSGGIYVSVEKIAGEYSPIEADPNNAWLFITVRRESVDTWRMTNRAGVSWTAVRKMRNGTPYFELNGNPYRADGWVETNFINVGGSISFSYSGGTSFYQNDDGGILTVKTVDIAGEYSPFGADPKNTWLFISVTRESEVVWRMTNRAGVSWTATRKLRNGAYYYELSNNPYTANGWKETTFKYLYGVLSFNYYGGANFMQTERQIDGEYSPVNADQNNAWLFITITKETNNVWRMSNRAGVNWTVTKTIKDGKPLYTLNNNPYNVNGWKILNFDIRFGNFGFFYHDRSFFIRTKGVKDNTLSYPL